MPSASNAKVEIELGQQYHAMAVMTDSGDHQYYTISGGTVWVPKVGLYTDVRPNGDRFRSEGCFYRPEQPTTRSGSPLSPPIRKARMQTVTATSATVGRPTTAGYYLDQFNHNGKRREHRGRRRNFSCIGIHRNSRCGRRSAIYPGQFRRTWTNQNDIFDRRGHCGD